MYRHVSVQIGLAREIKPTDFTSERSLGMLNVNVSVELGFQNEGFVTRVALEGAIVFMVCLMTIEAYL